MWNMHFYPQFIWLKLKLTVDRKHGIGRKFSHVTIQTEELGYFKPECIFLIIIHQPVHILTRNIKTVSMSNNMLSLAKKVLIYCTISDSSFQIFNQKGLSIIIEMNAYWLLLLSRGILIRRFSESIHQLYRRTLMHPWIVTSLKSNLRCSINLMHIFWYIFLLHNTFSKEHLWGAAFEKCCYHNQLQRHFSTLEEII